ncbi:MAG: sugar ABC transporter ATP-binding protein, partial [Armatimonadetes bacterium]|nr:sugar ABC transporter ATP-binding protein [Armatimonadota bacterium]
TGVYGRDDGSIVFEGRPIDPRSPLEAQHLGISTVYQEVNLIPDLSVAENILLGRQPVRRGRIDWRETNRRAVAAMARLELALDVTQPVRSYSIAVQQLVAIARALDVRARLLVLDEPTSSLEAHETARLFDLLRRLRDGGLAIVFVTHFLDQVYQLSDRVTVLRNGRLVGEWATAELSRIELIARMLGKEQRESEREQGLLVAAGLGRRGMLAPVDLTIGSGEVVGLGGLLGSGRSELARLLFGLELPDHGTVTVAGQAVRLGSPPHAIAAGMGYCPEDRQTDGIVPDLSLRENLVLALQARRGLWRRLSRKEQAALASRFIAALGIATPDAKQPVRYLSGGNQQKALLARWLAAGPRLLILDEPTRGIDVGAKAEVEKLVAELRAQGLAVLFISSELEEVVRACGRVIVLRDRAKVGELSGDAVDEPRLLNLIAEEAPGE